MNKIYNTLCVLYTFLHSMNITSFANNFVRKYNDGWQMTMEYEFYHDNVVSREPIEWWTTSTLEEKIKRNERFFSLHQNIQTHMTEPVIAGNFFTTKVVMTSEDKWEHVEVFFQEICVFEVCAWKIIREWFFYDLPSNLQ